MNNENDNSIIEGNFEELKKIEVEQSVNVENELNYDYTKNSKNKKIKNKKSGFYKNVMLTVIVAGVGFYAGKLFSNYELNFTVTEKMTGNVVIATEQQNVEVDVNKSSLVFNNESKQVEDSIEATENKNNEIKQNGDFRDATNTVVSISAKTIQGQSIFSSIGDSSGSGVIFATDDEYVYMLTNNHVVNGTTAFEISLDDEVYIEAKILGTDSENDIAIIYALKESFENNNIDYTVAKIGDSDNLQLGDDVYAIGNSAGEGKSLTSGIVGALNKEIKFNDGTSMKFIQTDAAINPGNSGGALVDEEGYLVGINTAKLVDSSIEGMGYSIPINYVMIIADDLIKMAEEARTKPFIGIQGQSVSDKEELRGFRGIPDGAYIEMIVVNSGADKAGLRGGDIITQIDNEKISSFEDLSDVLSNYEVGDTIEIVIFRNGDYLKINIDLGSRADY